MPQVNQVDGHTIWSAPTLERTADIYSLHPLSLVTNERNLHVQALPSLLPSNWFATASSGKFCRIFHSSAHHLTINMHLMSTSTYRSLPLHTVTSSPELSRTAPSPAL